MPSRRIGEAVFGVLGKAHYDSEASVWKFQRQAAEECDFSVSSTQQLKNALPQLRTLTVGASSTDRIRSTRHLLLKEPSFASVRDILPELAQVSEYVVQTSAAQDASVSTIAAFLEIGATGERKVDRETLFACVTGDCRDSIELTRVSFSWSGDSQIGNGEFLLPQLDADTTVRWQGKVSCPLQQLCSSVSRKRAGSVLAARSTASTIIFRPTCTYNHLGKKDQDGHDGDALSASAISIEANQILHVPVSQTGGQPHIDVTFSPWDEETFAILDGLGHCSILHVGYGHNRSIYMFRVVATSSPRPGIPILEGKIPACNHMWGKILWATNERTLVVCNRSILSVYRPEDALNKRTTSELDLTGKDELILDLKRDASLPELLFVLTTDRLICLRISTEPNEASDQSLRFSTVLLSLTHSWHAQASLLGLAVSPARNTPLWGANVDKNTNSEYTILTIFSRSTYVFEIFTFGFNVSSPRLRELTTPFFARFEPQKPDSSTELSSGLVNLLVRDVDYRLHKDLEQDAEETQTRCFQYWGIGDRQHVLGLVVAYSASWMKALPHCRWLDLDGSNGDMQQNVAELEFESRSRDKMVLEALRSNKAHGSSRKTFNYVRIMEAISRRCNRIRSDPSSFHPLQAILLHNLGGFEPQDFAITPLSAVVSRTFTFSNIGPVSKSLENLMQEFRQDRQDSYAAISLLIPEMIVLFTGSPVSGTEKLSLGRLHTHIHRLWVKAYSKVAPQKLHIELNHLARQISLEVFLSTVAMQRKLPQPATQATKTAEDDSQITESHSHQSHSLQRQRSQRTSLHQESEVFGQQVSQSYDPTEFLSCLATVQPRDTLPDQLSRILGEWELGTDPGSYDWQRARDITELVGTSVSQSILEGQLAGNKPGSSQSRSQRPLEHRFSQPINSSQIASAQTSMEMDLDTQAIDRRETNRSDVEMEDPDTRMMPSSTQQTDSSHTGLKASSSQAGTQLSGKSKDQKKKRRQGF